MSDDIITEPKLLAVVKEFERRGNENARLKNIMSNLLREIRDWSVVAPPIQHDWVELDRILAFYEERIDL